jgi:hypothetical protein
MNYIKENVPGITKVEYFTLLLLLKLFIDPSKPIGLQSHEYFTDGCKAQYKNCKSFLNLCYHLEDFGINAEWSFHTTWLAETIESELILFPNTDFSLSVEK